MVYGILKNFWHILFSSRKVLLGGIVPITIFVSILASFALLYTNTFGVIDFLFSIKKHSIIFKVGTKAEEIEKVFKIIKDYSLTEEVSKVSPAELRKEISESFEKINQELESLQLEKFPHLIEFVLKENQDVNELITFLKARDSTHTIISGTTISDQIETLLVVIENLGILFLLLFAISLFYIVNHTIQVSIFYFLKEIEVYLILGASKLFIYVPFLLLGLFISIKSFLLGIFFSYFLFLLAVSVVTFNQNSFFLRDVIVFFENDFLLLSLYSFLAISFISSFSAIFHAIKKITF